MDLQKHPYHPLIEQLRTEFSPNRHETNQAFDTFISSQNIKLFVRRWTSTTYKVPRGVIIIFHGFGGHGEYYVLLADQLIGQGFEVLVFDYPGHGLSEGKRGELNDLRVILADCKKFILETVQKYSKVPLFLCGESMGGTVLANLLVSEPELPPIKGIIFFAPGVKLRASGVSIKDILKNIPLVFYFLFNRGALAFSTRNQNNPKRPNGSPLMHPAHFEYDRTNPLHLNYVTLHYLLQLKHGFDRALKLGPTAVRMPSIIFYGGSDQAIDREGVQSFFDRIEYPDKKLYIVEGAPHAVFTSTEFQSYWKVLVDWLNEKMAL